MNRVVITGLGTVNPLGSTVEKFWENVKKGTLGVSKIDSFDTTELGVSKIVKPAAGYYQAVLPDGSNTTFKDNGKGGFECLNAHSTMTKSGNEYTITNAAQSQYHFNADGELDWVKDAEGNILTISSMSNNQRIVTDSTGRTYSLFSHFGCCGVYFGTLSSS